MILNSKPGYSLIEILFVILFTSILATLTVSVLRGSSDGTRWLNTQEKMEVIKRAILGEPTTGPERARSNFGYLGDMGRLPPSITALTTPEAPLYSVDTYHGVGAGWRGPYVTDVFKGEYALELDDWGRAFVYSTTSSPPSLTSYGADGVSGGTSHDTDLTLQFPDSLRLATVQGLVINRGNHLNGQTVELRYPVAGTLTAFVTTSDANGFFSFGGVPHGVRSIRVPTVTPILGPNRVVIDAPTVAVAPSFVDQSGRFSVTYNAGSAAAASGAEVITVNNPQGVGDSTARTSLTLDYTIPSGTGSSNLVLIVAFTAERASTNVSGNKCYFGSTQMSAKTSKRTDGDNPLVGVKLCALKVSAGWSRTITVNWGSTMDKTSLHAVTLGGVGSTTTQATAVKRNNTGDTTDSITTTSDGAMVVSAGVSGNANALSAVGLLHVLDHGATSDSHAGGIGHIPVPLKGTISGIGFTSASTNKMAQVLAAFTAGATGTVVTLTLTSTYPENKTLDYLTAWWDSSALLTGVTLADSAQQAVGRIPAGVRNDIYEPMVIPAGSTNTTLALEFTASMGGRTFSVTFEWATGEKDTISFTTP